MNFSRFPRTNIFDFRREPPAQGESPASTARSPLESDEPTRLPSLGPSAPAPPVLTRPRSGAGGSLAVRRDVLEDGAQGGVQAQAGGGAGGADSITLGQLKAHTQAVQQKQKVSRGPLFLAPGMVRRKGKGTSVITGAGLHDYSGQM